MEEAARRCEVLGFHEKIFGNFIKYGKMIVHDEGNHPLQIDCAIVETDSGRVYQVDPNQILFIKES
jgi:hypothetical protein